METTTNELRIKEPSGIGGWLIIPAIGLFVRPVQLMSTISNDFMPIFKEGYWSLLTTPGTELYHPLWAPLLFYEIAGNIFFIIFDIVLIFLFFRKFYLVPILFVTIMLLSLLFIISDFFLANLIPAIAAESNPELIKELIKATVGALIWIPYFLVSKRVKNTFIKQG